MSRSIYQYLNEFDASGVVDKINGAINSPLGQNIRNTSLIIGGGLALRKLIGNPSRSLPQPSGTVGMDQSNQFQQDVTDRLKARGTEIKDKILDKTLGPNQVRTS
jgi:hypothetical protein